MANKRYKILNGALDYLRTSDEGVNPDAPLGTPLKLYQDWKKGARNITYDTTNWKTAGELRDVAIFPFFKPYAAGDDLIVPASGKTLDSAVVADYRNQANIVAEPSDSAVRGQKYTPAKCTVSVPDASKNDATATSQLTGIQYNKVGRQSFTFPYGKSATVDYEQTVRADILAATPAEADVQISFSSERY